MNSSKNPDLKEMKWDAPPIPKVIHYVWVGGPIKELYLKNMIQTAELAKRSGFVVNLWVDNQKNIDKTFEKMTSGSLDRPTSKSIAGIQVRNIRELLPLMETDPFFKQDDRIKKLQNFINREMVGFKNLAAAADFLRYIILLFEGGYYLDTDVTLSDLTHLKAKEFKQETLMLGFKANIKLICDRGSLKQAEFLGNNNIIATLSQHPILKDTIAISLKNYHWLDKTPLTEYALKKFHLTGERTEMDSKRWPYSAMGNSDMGNKDNYIGRRGLTTNYAAGPVSLMKATEKFWQASVSGVDEIPKNNFSASEKEQKAFKLLSNFLYSLTIKQYDDDSRIKKIAGIEVNDVCDNTWLIKDQNQLNTLARKARAFDTDNININTLFQRSHVPDQKNSPKNKIDLDSSDLNGNTQLVKSSYG